MMLVQDVPIVPHQAMFEACPNRTIVVEGDAILARNAAFLSRFGDATSLLAFLDPRHHAAVITVPDACARGATCTATPLLVESAGVPMRWTAWALGEGKTCVRLDGEETPRDPKLEPLEPILSGQAPSPVVS